MYKEIKRCRICGNDRLLPVLDIGKQALSSVFPKTVDEFVTIGIYDITGGEIKSLVHAYKEVGSFQVKWDATDNYGNLVSAGVYLVRMGSGVYSKNIKVMLLK